MEKELPEHLGSMAHQDLQVVLDPLDQQVQVVHQEHQEPGVLLVLQEVRAQLDLQAQLDLLGQQERRGARGQLEPPVHRDLLEHLEVRERLVHRVQQVPLVFHLFLGVHIPQEQPTQLMM